MRLTGKTSDGTYFIKSNGLYGGSVGAYTTQARTPEMIAKLAEFENFMEEQGFEDLEHLKMQLDQYENCMVLDHDTGKWLKISDIMAENQALKARWEKLKEYLTQKPEDGYVNCYFEEEILEKMQELEK